MHTKLGGTGIEAFSSASRHAGGDWRKAFLGVGLAALLFQAHAAGLAEHDAIAGGIISEQTRTSMGYAFFQAFAAAWRERDGEGKYSLSIAEAPSVRQGSLITVLHGQRRVFQARIPRNTEQIRRMGEQVANGVFDEVALIEVSSMLFRDPDLGREGL